MNTHYVYQLLKEWQEILPISYVLDLELDDFKSAMLLNDGTFRILLHPMKIIPSNLYYATQDCRIKIYSQLGYLPSINKVFMDDTGEVITLEKWRVYFNEHKHDWQI